MADKAAALVAERLPLVVTGATGDFGDWRVGGPALIARATDTLSAAFRLEPVAGIGAAEVLARALFEQVVTFAWLAASPEERMPQWEASEYREREKLRNRIEGLRVRESYREIIDQVFRAPLIDGPRWEETRRLAEGTKMPDLFERCIQADKDWRLHIPDLEQHPFAHQYNLIYSHFSMSTHAGVAATLRHARALPDAGGIEVGGPFVEPWERGPWGLSLVLYLLMLVVSARSLGWPNEADVYRVLATS